MSRVRVACRVRPLFESGEEDCITVNDNTNITFSSQVGGLSFLIDAAYGPQSTQEELFDGVARPLIEEAFRGFNCTLFSYGQTGSGKTHTLQGKPGPLTRGILPRTVEDIFQQFSSLSNAEEPTLCELRVSIMEIYQERLRDLLVAQGAASLTSSWGGQSGPGATDPLRIRQKADGGVWVEGLAETRVLSEAQFSDMLALALKKRATGSHAMNAESSRSHLVTILSVRQTKSHSGERVSSKIHLIDLAGSEMVRKTDASGLALMEAKHINKSLSALGNVIYALTDPAAGKTGSHVPFRDSKLTRLLQDSLGGNAKTVLLLAVASAHSHAQESINTLKFGERARQLCTKPRVNAEVDDANVRGALLRAEAKIATLSATVLLMQTQMSKLVERQQVVSNNVRITTDEKELSIARNFCKVCACSLSGEQTRGVVQLFVGEAFNGVASAQTDADAPSMAGEESTAHSDRRAHAELEWSRIMDSSDTPIPIPISIPIPTPIPIPVSSSSHSGKSAGAPLATSTNPATSSKSSQSASHLCKQKSIKSKKGGRSEVLAVAMKKPSGGASKASRVLTAAATAPFSLPATMALLPPLLSPRAAPSSSSIAPLALAAVDIVPSNVPAEIDPVLAGNTTEITAEEQSLLDSVRALASSAADGFTLDEEGEDMCCRCAVCGLDEEGAQKLRDETNEVLGTMFTCDGNCGLMFHARCVGMCGEGGQFAEPDGEWYCSACTVDGLWSGAKNSSDQPSAAAAQSSVSASTLEYLKAEYHSMRRERNRVLTQWQQERALSSLIDARYRSANQQRDIDLAAASEKCAALEEQLVAEQRENRRLKSIGEELLGALHTQAGHMVAGLTIGNSAPTPSMSPKIRGEFNYGVGEMPQTSSWQMMMQAEKNSARSKSSHAGDVPSEKDILRHAGDVPSEKDILRSPRSPTGARAEITEAKVRRRKTSKRDASVEPAAIHQGSSSPDQSIRAVINPGIDLHPLSAAMDNGCSSATPRSYIASLNDDDDMLHCSDTTTSQLLMKTRLKELLKAVQEEAGSFAQIRQRAQQRDSERASGLRRSNGNGIYVDSDK